MKKAVLLVKCAELASASDMKNRWFHSETLGSSLFNMVSILSCSHELSAPFLVLILVLPRQTSNKSVGAKRTEEERIEYLRTDPYAAQFEAYRVLCASCDK
jgi:hypothetical protein